MIQEAVMTSVKNKTFLILVSFVAGTIIYLHVLQKPGEFRFPVNQFLDNSSTANDSVVTLRAAASINESSMRKDQASGNLHGLEAKKQMECTHLLSLDFNDSDSEARRTVESPMVKGRISVLSYVGNRAESKLKKGKDLPVPECNNVYVSVTGSTKFKPDPKAKHKLPPVSDIQKALKQIQGCAKRTGVSDFIQRENRTRAVFIMTVWRSGSSFFGEALSSHPSFYYYYEPLMYLGQKQLGLGESRRRSVSFQKQIDLLRDLKNCNYGGEGPFKHHIKSGYNTLALNNKIHQQCSSLGPAKCTSPEFINGACRIFPIPLFKLTRLRGFSGEALLKEFPGSKLIYLFRDPRGTYASRQEMSWCKNDTACGNISGLCCSLELDLDAVRYLQRKYPEDVQVVKYEHIVLNPVGNFKRILKKLNITWHPNIEKYLWKHTKRDTYDKMSTVKDSASHAEKWKRALSLDVVEKLQDECELYMKELGYSFMKIPKKMLS